MGAFTYQSVFIMGQYCKDQSATIYLDQLGGCGNPLPYLGCGYMAHTDKSAYRGLTFSQLRLYKRPGCALHQANHHRRTKYLYTSGSEVCGSMFVCNYQ
jgi:hypothetical protein